MTLGLFAAFLAGEVWLASPAIRERVVRASGPQGGVLVGLWPLVTYLVYALGTGSLGSTRVGIAVAYALAPVLLAATAHGAKPGAWQDYVGMAAIFVPFKAGWLNLLFPGAELQIAGVLPLLFAVNVALAAFLFVRQMEGVGYSIGWRAAWAGVALLAFAAIAAVDIPAALALHFIRFDPRAAEWRGLPLALVGTFVLTAWPEELLFRGLLQNALSKTVGGDNGGWVAASVIFGLAHITNGGFPNWRYALLAAVAGLGYGWAWRRSGSIFPSAMVHTLVDVTWHLLFPTL
jgi:membrane protease YdiL (CAAX protease family)